MIYAAAVCPFLRHPSAKRHYGRGRGNRRGNAQIVAFRRYGLAHYDEPLGWYDDEVGAHWNWAYTGLAGRTAYGSYTELQEDYREALDADAKTIDVSTRLYWGADDRDRIRLAQTDQRDQLALAHLRRTAWVTARSAGPDGYWVSWL
ncbi:hypothetical protein A5692_23520 [Mycobacterium sp. E342]|nr:hypothetical protein A5692_23520 [Mycobacterium sp. E342]